MIKKALCPVLCVARVQKSKQNKKKGRRYKESLFCVAKEGKYLHSKRGGCSMKLVKRAVVKSGVWDTLIWQ